MRFLCWCACVVVLVLYLLLAWHKSLGHFLTYLPHRFFPSENTWSINPFVMCIKTLNNKTMETCKQSQREKEHTEWSEWVTNWFNNVLFCVNNDFLMIFWKIIRVHTVYCLALIHSQRIKIRNKPTKNHFSHHQLLWCKRFRAAPP